MRFRPIPSALALLVAAGTLTAGFTNPYAPPYRGLPDTEYGAWESFGVPSGGPNLPDDFASTTVDATIENLEPSAFDIGGNIYSFSAPLDCVLSDSVPSDLQELDLQICTLGAELDYNGVVLVYLDGQAVQQSLPPTDVTFLFNGPNQGAGGGIRAETLFSWDLGSNADDITSYEIHFKGAAPSLSLDAVVLDTRSGVYATTFCAQTKPTSVAGCTPSFSITNDSLATGLWTTTNIPRDASLGTGTAVGIYIYTSGVGTGQSAFNVSVPFGQLCLQSLSRSGPAVLPGVLAGVCNTGTLTFAPHLLTTPAVAVGQDINAQLWYRDPIGSPTNGNANLSNAVFYTLQ